MKHCIFFICILKIENKKWCLQKFGHPVEFIAKSRNQNRTYFKQLSFCKDLVMLISRALNAKFYLGDPNFRLKL